MSEKKTLNIKFCSNECDIPSYVQEISSNKDYTKWGDNNLFPQYLLQLFYNSSLHNALITAKTDYIFGNGLISQSENINIEAFIKKCNNKGESLNWILKKCAFDLELFGGFALQIIYTKLGGRIAEIYYVDIAKLRIDTNTNKVLYSNDWSKFRTKTIKYDLFNLNNPEGSQIYFYKDYCSREVYPYPNYIAAIADITTDAEISKFRLSTIQNGLFPGLLIDFKNGEPTEDEKAAIEDMIKEKWGGSNKAGKIIVNFSENTDSAPTVTPIQQPDLDKMFIAIEESNREKIFTGHRITSPALFGVQTPGKLGTSNELQDAYTLFTNTYIKPTQQTLITVFNNILSINFPESDLIILSTDPVNNMFISENIISDNMTINEIRTKLKETGWIDNIDIPEEEQISKSTNKNNIPVQAFELDSLDLEEGKEFNLEYNVGKFRKGDKLTVIYKQVNNNEVELKLQNQNGIIDFFYFDLNDKI